MDSAVSGLSLSKAALQSQLSKSARFQAFASNTGTPLSEANALLRIKLDAWPFPLDTDGRLKESYTAAELADIRPFAMIFADRAKGYALSYAGAPTCSVESGMLRIHFEKDITAALRLDPESLHRQWDNDLAVIAAELIGLKTTDGMLQIDQSIVVQGPFLSTEQQSPGQGVFAYGLLTVSWGGLQG